MAAPRGRRRPSGARESPLFWGGLIIKIFSKIRKNATTTLAYYIIRKAEVKSHIHQKIKKIKSEVSVRTCPGPFWHIRFNKIPLGTDDTLRAAACDKRLHASTRYRSAGTPAIQKVVIYTRAPLRGRLTPPATLAQGRFQQINM